MRKQYSYSVGIVTLFLFLLFQNSEAQQFTSVIGDSPDPFLTYQDGYYYLTGTYGAAVGARRAKTLEGLRTAKAHIFYGPADGGPPGDYWASEIFRIDGKWYIYYTADPTTTEGTDQQRMYVIENTSEDPYTGIWTNHRIFDPANDVWAIDATVFEHNDELYYVYSGSDVHDDIPHKPQNIYIAKMSNPWTLATERVLLSEPTASWEGDQVNEGPEVIKHGNRIFIAYSTFGCWTPNYRLGMLYMDDNADPLEPESWTKHNAPVFQGNGEIGVYGPGHHCFFKSPDGTEDWFAYHAVSVQEGGCNDKRSIRAQRLYWSADNLPVFGQPIRQGEQQVVPSGEIDPATTTPLPNGIYEIRIKSNDNLALDLDNCNLDIGTNVKVWTDTDNRCQRWILHANEEGYYTISSYESGMVLDVNNCSGDENANIGVYKPNGANCQQWEITELGEGIYTIASRNSGKLMQIVGGMSPGDNLVQHSYTNQDNQKWSLTRVDDYQIEEGIYVISSKKSGLALQPTSCNASNGTGIIQNTLSGDDCQQWQIKSDDEGFYTITSVSSGKVLDVPSCSATPAERLQLWDAGNNDCQKFRIIPTGMNGGFKILAKANEMSLDVGGCSADAGVQIGQYPYWGADCQLWNFEAVTEEQVSVIKDGKARFNVLTPTLIRMEYAGDGVFEEKNSFTITNLDLDIPAYTTSVNEGWRIIETDELILKYKQNSGPFDENNLTVKLKSSGNDAEVKPWPSVFTSHKKEAEDMMLLGSASTDSNHAGYTGSGFVAGLAQEGSGMEWNLNENIAAGNYTLAIQYANGTGGDGQHKPRTMSLYIDGEKTQLTLPQTLNWGDWQVYQHTISLDKGTHKIKLIGDAGDTYNVNVDWISINPIPDFNAIYEAEEAILEGSASVYSDHAGHTGAGFVGGLNNEGAAMTYHFDNTQDSGDYTISIKYANGEGGDAQHVTRTISLYVDGVRTQISLPKTDNWGVWDVFEQTLSLSTGPHTIKLSCDAGDTYNVNIDWLAVTGAGESIEDIQKRSSANLGGGLRSLDLKSGEVPLWNGLMSRDGWYLLDDSKTALREADGWVSSRPQHDGGYQDAYFFGYGTNYQTALQDFYKITGTPPLLPQWAFGVWYSKYEPYTSTYYKETLVPKFRAEEIPLDVLVIDTDWKSPHQWNGWNWNSNLFPDPKEFLDWTQDQGLAIALNIHATIQQDDPKFAQANATAGGLVDDNNDGRYHFDYSQKNHAQAYLDLHKPFNEQGVDFWWPDWVDEYVSMNVKGLSTETWQSHLYAKDREERGMRPFSFARIGDGYKGYGEVGPPDMAWSDHRYTLHFTGDTFDDWSLLEFAATFTIKEGNLGIPYVSHDMGSFKGRTLPDDKYIRWLQFGTFQPIFRLHSDDHDDSYRLPWQYPNVEEEAKELIRLRHSLVPYTYSLAREASSGGMPIVRGMYFYFPEAEEAYSYDKQYLFGDNILVSPITSAGEVASTEVWFPEGKWTNYFTDEVITGPTVKTISADYTSMAAFVKAGGIIPLKPYSDFVGQKAMDTLNLKVYTGANGSFELYEDEGKNLGYKNGQYAITQLSYSDDSKELKIGSQQGNFTGAVTERAYIIEVRNIIADELLLNGEALNLIEANTGQGWWLDDDVIYIHLNKRDVKEETIIIFKEATASIDDVNRRTGIKLYPNPSSSDFQLELFKYSSNLDVSIFDVHGKLVQQASFKNKTKVKMDTTSLSQGVYVVKAITDRGVFSTKLIVN